MGSIILLWERMQCVHPPVIASGALVPEKGREKVHSDFGCLSHRAGLFTTCLAPRVARLEPGVRLVLLLLLFAGRPRALRLFLSFDRLLPGAVYGLRISHNRHRRMRSSGEGAGRGISCSPVTARERSASVSVSPWRALVHSRAGPLHFIFSV